MKPVFNLCLKAEEAPSALLLAHAALLSARKHAGRRAALLYVSAANRLEKCGIVGLVQFLLSVPQSPIYSIDRNHSQCIFYDVPKNFIIFEYPSYFRPYFGSRRESLPCK